MPTTGLTRGSLATRIVATLLLVALGEAFGDGSEIGSVIGAFALAWVAVLVLVRPVTWRGRGARVALVAALGFGAVLVDDPNPLAWLLFLTALSLAALLPRRRFDDAFAWAQRLAWHAISGPFTPLADASRRARLRRGRGGKARGARSVAALLALPLIGGAIFVALFAGANPLIGDAIARLQLPDPPATWRIAFAVLMVAIVWPSLRPSRLATGWAGLPMPALTAQWMPGTATLVLSLATFNAIFAVQNILDIVFLWSGAPLPADVTMAEYAHRGAYALIVTALLAGLFVVTTLRPGSPAGANGPVRLMVSSWIAQNLLLVASSVLRTLDYVDAYGMTTLRLAALAWMALVAAGLALIGWRLLAGRSTAWLVNASALAATLVLAVASVVDLGAAAATWNARVALQRGRNGPPLDLCYLASLGSSALVPLATLERRVQRPELHDRLAYLRWRSQSYVATQQANWRSWTGRDARRLAQVEAIAGTRPPALRAAPNGRTCDGAIRPPPPVPASTPLTDAPQR